MLTEARWNLLRKVAFLGGVHDAQARAWLHGRWDIAPDVLAIEAFKIHGRYYTYFGPWPAVLRLPVLMVTHRLDGRLTIISMLLAAAVVLVCASRIHWRLRTLMRPDAPVGRGDIALAALVPFGVAMGSIVTFLGSRPLVYHEMELWGVGGALATADASMRYLARPTVRQAAWCGLAATVTLMSRPSVGFGAVITVLIVFLFFQRQIISGLTAGAVKR